MRKRVKEIEAQLLMSDPFFHSVAGHHLAVDQGFPDFVSYS